MEQTPEVIARPTYPLYVLLARTLEWNPPATWADGSFVKHAKLSKLIDMLPHGSGIDSDLHVEYKAGRILISFSYHHMNDDGMYDGWTDHTVTVIPSLAYGFEMRISGCDRNEIKDYLAQCFDCMLRETLEDF